jgi:hypothetical protein
VQRGGRVDVGEAFAAALAATLTRRALDAVARSGVGELERHARLGTVGHARDQVGRVALAAAGLAEEGEGERVEQGALARARRPVDQEQAVRGDRGEVDHLRLDERAEGHQLQPLRDHASSSGS